MNHNVDLADVERRALNLMDRGLYGDAIPLWETLVGREPSWENGLAYDSLALCWERVGDLDKARNAQRRAYEIAPEYEITRGNWASFLARYGPTREALEFGVEYLQTSPFDNASLAQRLLQMAEEEKNPSAYEAIQTILGRGSAQR